MALLALLARIGLAMLGFVPAAFKALLG